MPGIRVCLRCCYFGLLGLSSRIPVSDSRDDDDDDGGDDDDNHASRTLIRDHKESIRLY